MAPLQGKTQTSMSTYQADFFDRSAIVGLMLIHFWHTCNFISSHQTSLNFSGITISWHMIWAISPCLDKSLSLILSFWHLNTGPSLAGTRLNSPTVCSVLDLGRELKYNLKYFSVLTVSSSILLLMLLSASSSSSSSAWISLASLSSSLDVFLNLLILVKSCYYLNFAILLNYCQALAGWEGLQLLHCTMVFLPQPLNKFLP